MDMAAGGTGAPLVPFVNFVLYKNKEKNVAFQNIGGIGNVTYIKKNANYEEVIAFDTGPGNMVIDLAMMKLYNKPFDEGGNVALSGVVNKEVLTKLLDDEYYNLPYPKSTGREKYNENYLAMILNMMKESKKEDIIAGLCKSVASNYLNNVGKGKRILGPIVFQGGVSKNIGVVKAFEELTGEKIIVDKNSHLLGALGVAILAKNSHKETKFDFNIQNILFETKGINCHGCANQCEIISVVKDHKVIDSWGNRCERGMIKN